jgi:hypothetical protein
MSIPMKEFPASWSEKKIIRGALEIITNPQIRWCQITGQDGLLCRPFKYIADGEVDGKKIRVVFEPEDRGILTVYPIN